MTEAPTGPDDAQISLFLEQQRLENAVVFKALVWRANMHMHDAATDLVKAVDEFVQFNLAHPDVSSPAHAAAGPAQGALHPAPAGPAVLTKSQREILAHTQWRAAGQMYCGSKDDPDIEALVALGYLRDCGTPGHLPKSDAYFTVTRAGKRAMDPANA